MTGEYLAAIVTSVTTPCLNRTPAPLQDADQAEPQIFLQALVFEIPQGARLDKQTHQLTAVSPGSHVPFFASPHLLATLGAKTTMSSEGVYYPPGATSPPSFNLAGVTLLPTLGRPETLLLDLDFELQVPSPPASVSPTSIVHVRNTFVAEDRRAVSMVTTLPGSSKTSIAIIAVPYLIQSRADLRDLFECKMQRAKQQRDTRKQ